MAKQSVFRGTLANDGTGDNLREGARKLNENFDELYTALGDGSTLSSGTFVTTAESQTLTNKSVALGSNTITGTTAQFNTALTDNDFATLAGSETLTNKVINASNNTLSNISNSSLSNSSITITGDDSSAQTISLGGSILFTGGSGVNTTISGNEITFATDGSIVTESSTDTLTNKTISGANNTLSNIGNASLSNSSITFGSGDSTNLSVSLGEQFEIVGGTNITTGIDNGRMTISNTNSAVTLGATSVSLGATAASAENFSITGSGSLSGTGTVNTTGGGNRLRFNVAGFGSLPSASTYEGMFAYDTTGTVPYVADNGGWVRLLTENDTIDKFSNVTTTGVANGQALIFNSSSGNFEPGSAGSSLTIEEDGSALSTAATTIDFVGEGVTASGTGSEKTINIPGGATAMLDISANGSSAYRFSSHYGTEDNPTIFTKQGQTIAINLNALAGAHPFVIQTSSGSTYVAGNRITTGLTHIATDGTVSTGINAQNKNSGILYFEVPYNQDTVYYICASHGVMNGTLSVAKKEGGALLQQVNVQSGAVATGTTIFPEDDTIPQNTEGDEFMTLSITPKSATSTLNIEAHIFYSCTNSTRGGAGLFKDSDANALAFTSNFIKDTTSMGNMQVFFSETSGSTSARTYKIRCGNIQTSGTFTFNGQGGARKFGGTVLSTIRILEIES